MTGPGPPAATIHQPPTGPQLGAATGSLTQGLPLEQISILSLLGLAWSLKVLWSPLGPPTVSAPGPPGAPQEQPWASPKVADNLATAVAIIPLVNTAAPVVANLTPMGALCTPCEVWPSAPVG